LQAHLEFWFGGRGTYSGEVATPDSLMERLLYTLECVFAVFPHMTVLDLPHLQRQYGAAGLAKALVEQVAIVVGPGGIIPAKEIAFQAYPVGALKYDCEDLHTGYEDEHD